MINTKETKLITAGLAFLIASTWAQDKPNVLFIAVDDLNDYVNCMNGSVSVPTPNIDKLAGEGILFLNAHCQAPICGPSRASIMTGLYPSSSGNYLQLRDTDIKRGSDAVKESVFMPDYFERYGYRTMAVGKIYHNGDDAETFDEYGGRFDWMGPKPGERFNYDPEKIPGKSGNTQTDWGAYPEHDSMMTDYKSAAWAVEKLGQDYDEPFFLAVGFVRPHVPWYVPENWFDKFPLDEIDTPPYLQTDFDDIPAIARRVAEAPMMPTTEELIQSGEWKHVLQAYMACIAFVDHQIGKVLNALENSNYADNTIIVLWADHGYHLGEKNRFAKQSLWERDTRTVFVVKDTASGASKKCNTPVQLLDIYPTLLDLCGLPENDQLEGHSLKGLIRGEEKDWPHPALSFYGEGNVAVRDERFRLIQYEDESVELYDMIEDPNEWYNLSGEPKYQERVIQMRSAIPVDWAPLSKYSKYNFNDYFKEKSGLN